jgi:hypothetical protein
MFTDGNYCEGWREAFIVARAELVTITETYGEGSPEESAAYAEYLRTLADYDAMMRNLDALADSMRIA